MLIPLGILASSGGAAAGSYELISTTILGSTQASVTFDVSTYASTYKHLQLRFTNRTDRAAADSGMSIRLNGDTGSNYRQHYMDAGYSGSSVVAGTNGPSTSMLMAGAMGNTNTANAFAAGVIDILDPFSSTKNKTLRALSGYAAGSGSLITLRSGLWMSTATVTSVSVHNWDGASYISGSRFSLYGIKGA